MGVVKKKKKIEYIYSNCSQLVHTVLGRDLPVSGNIGLFAQNEEEYQNMFELTRPLVYPSDNPLQKYFELKEPIGKFTHLYIRKPDPTPYGKYLGDIDFILAEEEYELLKKEVIAGKYPGAVMYDRPGWDTVQVVQSGIDVVSYISTMGMAIKARIKFD